MCPELLEFCYRLSLIWWSDEKIFYLEPPLNYSNDFFYDDGLKLDVSDDRLYHEASKFPPGFMVLWAVSMLGKIVPVFIETALRMDKICFQNKLREDVFPQIQAFEQRTYGYGCRIMRPHTQLSLPSTFCEKIVQNSSDLNTGRRIRPT